MRYDHIIESGFKRWVMANPEDPASAYTPGQYEAMSDFTNSFILLSGSYRSGKSELGARVMLRHATAFPGAKVGIFRNQMASLKRSTLLTILQLTHKSWVADWSNSDLTMTLHNGSTIVFLGCEFSDRIGSIELTACLLDEAHEISEESRGMIAGRLSGQLELPSMDYYRDPYGNFNESTYEYAKATVGLRQMFLAVNPKSKGHHIYRDFIESPKPGHIAYTSNSISNKFLPEIYLLNNLSAYVRDGKRYTVEWIREQIRAIRAGEKPTDGMFLMSALTPFGQRNLLGQWVAMEGGVWPQFDESVHVVSLETKTDSSGDSIDIGWGRPTEHIGAVDFGFNNPRIVVAGSYPDPHDPDDELLLVKDYWFEKESSPTSMVRAMKRFQDAYDIDTWYLPPDQPGIIKMARESLGAGVIARAKNSVMPGIDAVSRRISRGALKFAATGTEAQLLCIKEIVGYQWKENPQGGFKDEPLKEADHFPDSLRYLVYSRDHSRNIFKPEADEEPDHDVMTFSGY